MIIGISGKMCAGKDTLASYLLEYSGGSRIGFADKLKDICAELFDIDPRSKDDYVRRILQKFGTEVGRNIDQDVWVKYALRRAKTLQEPVIIPDVRFPNELYGIQAVGGIVIRVVCDEEVRIERVKCLYGEQGLERFTHPSETALDDAVFDYYVGTTSQADMCSTAEPILDLIYLRSPNRWHGQ